MVIAGTEDGSLQFVVNPSSSWSKIVTHILANNHNRFTIWRCANAYRLYLFNVDWVK